MVQKASTSSSVSAHESKYTNLSARQIHDIIEAFNTFDKDGDGRIDASEIASVFSVVEGGATSQQEIQELLRLADKDGDGCVDLAEFLSIHDAAEAMCVCTGIEGLKEAFRVFDVDRNGVISADELLRVMKGLGDENVTLQDCVNMIKGVDSDGDGCVDFPEFERMMSGVSPMAY